MFEEKIKMNRKKNLSSKIIVDEYDHLIKNSKIQPNFESFLQPPHSPHFNPKDIKYTLSKQQSSQSQYSIHNPKELSTQKQCLKCGQIFSIRLYDSHIKICQQKVKNFKKQQIQNFTKKNDYNLFPPNFNHPYETEVTSARHNGHKDVHNMKESKKMELKKSTSKISIKSQDKNSIKRPSSSTRNKLELKGYQNLKEKILSKLQATRNRNFQNKEQVHKKGSSVNKNALSHSKPKSNSKNINGQKKYNTINSSSINKKNGPHNSLNYEFNRSQIIGGMKNSQNKKQSMKFISKTNLKEEKKNTLKKKNINSNNSYVLGQSYQRQKERERNIQNFDFKQNQSYFSQSQQSKHKFQRQKQFLKQQLRKEGVFRRQSSASGSKRNPFIVQQGEMMQQKPCNKGRDMNNEYFFFENHPSSVPSHVTKRQDRPYSRYQMQQQQQMFVENSSKIIRNKLGLNKNFIKNKIDHNLMSPQNKNKNTSQKMIQQHQKKVEPKRIHQRFQNENPQNQFQFNRQTNQSKVNQNNVNQHFRNTQSIRNEHREQRRYPNSQNNIPLPRQNQHPRLRPNNPMGNQRNINQIRQNINRPQNRPQHRINNQRINSQNQERQVPFNQPLRNRNQNQRRRQLRNNRPSERLRQNQNNNRQTNTGRRQQGQRSNNRIHQDTLNFISNTLNEQFQVMNEHFNLLNNIFSNFSNIVNVNITASTNNQNPTTFVFRSHGRRRNNRDQNDSSQSNSSCSDFSSDFSQDESLQNQTDYSEDEYYYEEQEDQNPGMTQHQINSIPVLRYNKQKHGSNQCTICLVDLNQNEPFKKLYCDHVFHTECIDEWLKRKNACPVCRDQMGVRY